MIQTPIGPTFKNVSKMSQTENAKTYSQGIPLCHLIHFIHREPFLFEELRWEVLEQMTHHRLHSEIWEHFYFLMFLKF